MITKLYQDQLDFHIDLIILIFLFNNTFLAINSSSKIKDFLFLSFIIRLMINTQFDHSPTTIQLSTHNSSWIPNICWYNLIFCNQKGHTSWPWECGVNFRLPNFFIGLEECLYNIFFNIILIFQESSKVLYWYFKLISYLVVVIW